MKTTQAEKILAHLGAGNSITALEALSLFGCNRLAARIYDLRTMYSIHSRFIEVTTAAGEKAHVAQYYLDPLEREE